MDLWPLFFIFACFVLYLPSAIGEHRRHHQRHAITALNLFLGWTFIGWVAALVWALTAVQPARPKD